MSRQSQSNSGLRRCWEHACLEENINPLKPSRLPLLFCLDAKLGVANVVGSANIGCISDQQAGMSQPVKHWIEEAIGQGGRM